MAITIHFFSHKYFNLIFAFTFYCCYFPFFYSDITTFFHRRLRAEDPKDPLGVTDQQDAEVISYLLLLLLVCQVICSPDSVRTASELVEQLEDVVSVIGRRYRGSLRSRVGEGECEEKEEKEEQEQKEQVEGSSDKDNRPGEETLTSSASVCSHCSSLQAQASRQEDALQLRDQETLIKQSENSGEILSKRLSLFECQEGCFSSSSPHTQQRVVIPSF